MATMQCTPCVPIRLDMRTFRPRARRRGPPRGDTRDRRLLIVAHLASLLAVTTLVIGLTFGSIAVARRCIGSAAAPALAAALPDDGGGSRSATTATLAGPSH